MKTNFLHFQFERDHRLTCMLAASVAMLQCCNGIDWQTVYSKQMLDYVNSGFYAIWDL